jgi:hypothetical protein
LDLVGNAMTNDFFSTGRYALVDVLYRNIWFNTYDKDLCLSIQQVFSSKMQVSIFDLTTFSNYSDTLIDSSVSLDWQIVDDNSIPLNVALKKNRTLSEILQASTYNSRLINNANEYPLSQERCKELQYQIYCYYNIVEKFKNIQSTDISIDIIASLNKIFQSEIHINVIKDKIYQLAEQYLKIYPLVAGKLLNFLDKNYE